MSTRWYPLYKRGNPQLRIFLPNFWLKLVQPTLRQPENTVQFECSMEMTVHDVKNYLEKIYNIPVIEVRSRIALGKTRSDKGGVTKDEDTKYAYVVLVNNEIKNINFCIADDNFCCYFLAQGREIHVS